MQILYAIASLAGLTGTKLSKVLGRPIESDQSKGKPKLAFLQTQKESLAG